MFDPIKHFLSGKVIVRQLLVFCAGLFLWFLSGCAGSLASDVTPPPNYQQSAPVSGISPSDAVNVFPLLPPDPIAGKPIYIEKCAPCHGESGMGDGIQVGNLPSAPAPLGEIGVSRTVLPAVWFQAVTRGYIEKFMPSFRNELTDRQRWDVVAYLLSLSTTEEQVEAGKQLFAEYCQACHGEGGRGVEGRAPALDREIILQKSLDGISLIISQGTGEMPPAGSQMTENERLNTALFARSLVFADKNTRDSSITQNEIEVSPQVLPLVEKPAGETGGSISGKVVNGSGLSLKPGLPVELTAYDDMQAEFVVEESTGLDGSFSFSNIPEKEGWIYLISVAYKGINYTSAILPSGQMDKLPPQVITVYETSTDRSSLRADRLHLFFEFDKPDIVRVVQMYVINNPTDNLITSEKPDEPVLNFPLPQGSANLEFQDGYLGQRFVETGDGFGDTRGIPPGSGTQIVFAYDLPYKTDTYFVLDVPLPVDTANVMLPANGVAIKSSLLQDLGEKKIQETAWRIYASGLIPAGSKLDILITGKPKGLNSPQSVEETNLAAGLILLGISILIATVMVYRWKNGTREIVPVNASSPLDNVSKEALLDAIIALDDQYQFGQIPRAAYEARRIELKDRLRELN